LQDLWLGFLPLCDGWNVAWVNMAGILTQAHFQRLEALRRVRHLLQGEEPSISLLKRDATNALVSLLSIDSGWTYSDADANGSRLPPQVMFELQIAEELIVIDDVKQTAGVQHGQQRFHIVQISAGEPGIFPPTGLRRFWRFWLAPLEVMS
jgi:hypothetical protein